jgi:hypothetical protein
MPLKPGNAFTQRKEFQQQRELETQNSDEDTPGSPMTTMSIFIGPDFPPGEPEGPAEVKTPANTDRSQRISTARGKMGKRSFTDPISASTAHPTITTESSSLGKQSSGFGYIKSKLTGRSKRKDFESPAQSFTKLAPSEYTPDMPSTKVLPITWRNEAMSKVVPTTHEKLPSQPLPSHVSTATMQTVATPQSRYTNLLKNDAMILGDLSMSPTRSGSYAIAGYPALVGVSHPSIMSLAGSIFETSPHNSRAFNNTNMFTARSALPESYDASYAAPLPPPPDDKFQYQLPFYLQLQSYEPNGQTSFEGQGFRSNQYDASNAGTWEQLHAQYPGSMPQFSPMTPHLYRNELKQDTELAERSDNVDKASDLKMASKTLLYSANASETKSENGKEALEAPENAEEAEGNIAITLRGSLRRSASDHELRYSSYQNISLNRTPTARKGDKPSRLPNVFSRALSPTAPVFESREYGNITAGTQTTLKPVRYEGERVKQSVPAGRILQNVSQDVSALHGASAPFYNQNKRQNSDLKGKGDSHAQNLGDTMTRGGYPSTPKHQDYQARSNLEEQMAHQFNDLHHHMEADKYTLRRCIEDSKNYLAEKSSSHIDRNFMNQFRQLCIQSNGFRHYLERIQLQTSDSTDMASRFAAHERRVREELGRLNRNVLTLTENVYAIQRNVNNHMTQMNTRMADMNRKLDMLLQAQGIDSFSGSLHARQGRDVMQQTSSPVKQSSTSPTKTRKLTPLPAKVPVMAAALTSTPPHVPQPPLSQSQSSSITTVSITDPSIPSPSAVSNARRAIYKPTREQEEAKKENKRIGNVAKDLGNTMPIQGLGSHVHPALRYQEGIESLAGVKEKEKAIEENDDNEVLWRRPSGDGEIGGRWYKAAMQQ